jgi:hypothetical protein
VLPHVVPIHTSQGECAIIIFSVIVYMAPASTSGSNARLHVVFRGIGAVSTDIIAEVDRA